MAAWASPRVSPNSRLTASARSRCGIASGSRRLASANPSAKSAQASPGRSRALAALSAAMRLVVTQSAQLFRRLNSGNRVGGRRGGAPGRGAPPVEQREQGGREAGGDLVEADRGRLPGGRDDVRTLVVEPVKRGFPAG